MNSFMRNTWAAVLLGAAASVVHGQTLTSVATFGGASGVYPQFVLQGSDGNLYGTTAGSDTSITAPYGTVFKLIAGGTLTTLYTFCALESCSDGAYPGGIVEGSDGNFYGTTKGIGASGNGTIFKITPSGAFTILHTFSVTDGANPIGNLIQGTDGNFYGTTLNGGSNDLGSVFKISPSGTLTTLYSFGNSSGARPVTGLIQGADGNFYGTTQYGGAGAGTIFRITLTGIFTTLYSFPPGGSTPLGSLIQGKDGNFYGTLPQGGVHGQGSVFQFTSAGALKSLYSFGSAASDGMQPSTALVQAPDGSFYGSTPFGGTDQCGTLFQITTGGILTTIHTFDMTDGCSPGLQQGGVILGSNGDLYGTTFQGGANYDGTIFRLQLPASAPYTCTNTTPPVITSITSASAYGGYSYFASGSWLEIKGINLADPADPRLSAATNPGQWTSADFSGVNAPTSLDGVSVSINGKAAYVWYLSPTQLNVQAPEDSTTGDVAVAATNCKATSVPFTFARRSSAPGFLAPSNYSAGGTPYLVATFASDGAYVLNKSTGAALGLNSRPAKPGDLIIAYGIGFGDVNPVTLPGVIVQVSNTLVNAITLSFGSTEATLSYAGLAGGFVGLYEFFITVPSPLANGDYQINVMQNGAIMPQIMYLTVQN